MANAVLEKGGEALYGPYEPVPEWPQPLHADFTWGRTPSVFAESPDRVVVLQSAELPARKNPLAIGPTAGLPAGVRNLPTRDGNTLEGSRASEHLLMVFDRNGKLVTSWEQHVPLFGHSHRLAMDPHDPARHVWIVDDGRHQVWKFTNDGKLVMTLGEAGVTTNDRTHFDGPTDIAFLPNGDFFITDPGHYRVVRYSKDGRYISQFGGQGDGPGELGPRMHGLAIDAKQRLYVLDRGNARIQVFDTNGNYLDHWPSIPYPCFIAISKDQYAWVTDADTGKILKYDLQGHLLYSWGTFGIGPGQLWGPHHLSTDSEGNLYIAEVYGARAQKFRPRQGADPNKLVGQLFWK